MSVAADEQLAWLALAEVGKRGTAPWYSLAKAMGGAARVFAATDAELAAAGVGTAAIRALRRHDEPERLGRIRAACAARSVTITTIAGTGYPTLLAEIPDPPLVLYHRGAPPVEIAPAIAVVGSRRATRYGLRVAFELARELAAAGLVITSGLAIGIDGAAHEGAVAAGRSAAVLAGGLDRLYPRSHRRLYERLLERGTILSEHPPGTPPLPHHFPVRNRIVTGLASATVIVEAAERSGSLISARLALDQGRELLAVPGNIDSETSRGSNALLREGCAPLLEVADVLHALGIETASSGEDVPATRQPMEKLLRDKGFDDPDSHAVAAALERVPSHVDQIIETCRLDGARVLELLTAFELEGLAQRLPGGMFVLADDGGLKHRLRGG
jgi:DNA processing protein